MRGFDYVGKRVLFAARRSSSRSPSTSSSSARSRATQCLRSAAAQCTQAFKEYQRESWGSTSPSGSNTSSTSRTSPTGIWGSRCGRSSRSDQLWPPLKNTVAMVALGTLFSIVFGVARGRGLRVEARHLGRQGRPLERARVLLDAAPVARAPHGALRRRLVRPADGRDQRSNARDPGRRVVVGGLRRPPAT